ncbi:MAG: DUF1684 domain-containing protein [Proteobacteria bacterium]|nr:DUF1684 domain-containing protein [Pseudomonadota bacterium]
MFARLGPKLCNGVLLLMMICLSGMWAHPQEKPGQQDIQRISEFRERRDQFFKEHPRSPLDDSQRGNFKSLTYYPIDLKYRFEGKIERYKYHIMNPKYYANFLTNKGIKKRYIRYGRFRFQINGKEFTIQLYKSPGSDQLFIPFRDKTNGNGTYEGGRYLDAEIIMPGYRTVIDFNMAYNPSCVYNEKYICIIPPEENNFDLEIMAGEKKFK